MRLRWAGSQALLVLALLAPAGPGRQAAGAEAAWRGDSGLVAALDAVTAPADREEDILVGVAVEDLAGHRIYSRHADSALRLASNTKLITTAAALLHLPPDFRWRTRAWWRDGILQLEGGGDPSLANRPGDPAADRFLDGLAEALRRAGAGAVRELRLDGRRFDEVFRHPGWPRDQWHREYCAPVSALAVEKGCLRIRVGPAGGWTLQPEMGGRLAVEERPGGRSGEDWRAPWLQGDSTLILAGRPARATESVLAVPDPRPFVRDWIVAGLERRGIPVAAARWAEPGDPEMEGPPLWTHSSAWTLAEAVAVANLDSDNFVSEMILKTLGRLVEDEGSFGAGVRAVGRILEAAGLDAADYQQDDGSGLARNAAGTANRSTPAAICALLRRMADAGKAGRVYFDSLPAGGAPGRLAERMRGALFQPRRVRAKTGWIVGASSLSGYLLAGEEDVLVFSVVVNYRKDGTARTNNRRFRELQDEVLATLLGRWRRD